MEDSKKDSLKQHQQELRTGVVVRNFLPALRMLLTDVEYSRIKSCKDNVDMVDELIDILLTKENRHFDGFCAALQNNGYEYWADKLKNNNPSHGVSTTKTFEGDKLPHRTIRTEQSTTLSVSPSKVVRSEAGTQYSFEDPSRSGFQCTTYSTPSCVQVRYVSTTEPVEPSLCPNESLSASMESITSTSVKLSHTGEEAGSGGFDRLRDDMLKAMEEISQTSTPAPLTVEERVEQKKYDCLEVLYGSSLCDGIVAGAMETLEDKVQVCDDLYEVIDAWKEKVQQVISHRTTGSVFTDWQGDAQELMKATASTRVAGYSTAIAGGAVFAVGSGLLIGGVTAPAGIPLIVIGGVIGTAGSITALGGSVANLVKTKRIVKKAQRWVQQNQTVCRELVVAHDCLMDRKARVERLYPYINVDKKLSEIFGADFPQVLDGIAEIVGNWKKALSYGPEEVTNMLVTAVGSSATIAQGVIGGVDTGVEAAAVTAKATAKLAGASVAVGLSAVLMCVDIALLAKASYDLHKSRKGQLSKLAEVMNELAVQVDTETRMLTQAVRPMQAVAPAVA